MGSLEEAIKQKEFKDPYNKLVVNLLFTHSYMVSAQNGILKPFDLSPEQYNVLRILRGQNGVPTTVSSIQDRMLNKMSNASRLVDKLKAKELVERRECPSDRRQVDILITEKGLQILNDLHIHMEGFNNQVINLSEEEVILMNNLLDKLRG
ncbi:MarR family winged helix-turn-helix transcriptional regulator [Algoriphagus aquimarinus]|uniref:DNA-binding transcriptional regulator, MarR family n=1 Tax=Algoriphagus aquimarinus TaxID=237018 RepID=A0A1I1C1Q7_9BACT|nr:MarR family transcriptional regulator [Algoriphagus aquimarinus]SFB56052.1 DNA-binding transcriptional regulator, MarR family [Algoriphagus aquimarinus]|tara:strand:- start:42904 stop:43356 length:453 start_codon:yes stop_codon:yes gene_type:complete